ncbi:hypothetical protein J7T55_013581 [Diaporthe amygdali]|uniref:uncharacterized protein n=1 Tax=Phomopsis amygdali TaxID=1214568 RepID=UPI0022FE1832|nr:uncharacterized protein J7T55_013581 [Diaporthe amygdali]KAJ0119343.1 hypothetical protein J7T55_013581 [Diaporthe amygdali]
MVVHHSQQDRESHQQMGGSMARLCIMSSYLLLDVDNPPPTDRHQAASERAGPSDGRVPQPQRVLTIDHPSAVWTGSDALGLSALR